MNTTTTTNSKLGNDSQKDNGNKFKSEFSINNLNNESANGAKNSFPQKTFAFFKDFRYNSRELVRSCRNSRKLVLLVVFIALFFDNMLLTTIGKYKFMHFCPLILLNVKNNPI